MPENSNDGPIVDLRQQLRALNARVDSLYEYRDTDAQTTIQIERQIELLQLQIDRLSELMSKIGVAVGLDE